MVMRGFKCDSSTFHNGTTELDFSLNVMQIDNQLPGSQFPVMLGAAPVRHMFADPSNPVKRGQSPGWDRMIPSTRAPPSLSSCHPLASSFVLPSTCRTYDCLRACVRFCVTAAPPVVDGCIVPHPEAKPMDSVSKDLIGFRMQQKAHDTVSYISMCSFLMQKLSVNVRRFGPVNSRIPGPTCAADSFSRPHTTPARCNPRCCCSDFC